MSKQAVDIWGDFLAAIEVKPEIVSFSDDELVTTIEVSNTYHLRRYMNVIIDGIVYEVISMTGNSIVVTGVLTPLEIIIQNPFYIHGTPMNTNVLLGDIGNFKEKSPLNYLYEMLTDAKDLRPGALTERRVNIVAFILDNSEGDWTATEHYDEVIDRLSTYVDILEHKILSYPKFNADEMDKIVRISHANFGKFMDKQGYVNHIFDEVYSGIEIRLTLCVKTSLGCENQISN